jgi:predicted kinase
METDRPHLVLVTGIMASGKSSVAQRLAERFARSVHLRGDTFRTMIVHGRAERKVPLDDEAFRQVELRYAISADAAARYLDAGFRVVYQDVVIGEPLRRVARDLAHHRLHVIVLCPRADVVSARDRSRHKRAYHDAGLIEHYDRVLREGTPRIGRWLDTSELEIEDTVLEILADLEGARVTAADVA